jgi:hypothetical protein
MVFRRMMMRWKTTRKKIHHTLNISLSKAIFDVASESYHFDSSSQFFLSTPSKSSPFTFILTMVGAALRQDSIHSQ